MIVFPAIDIKDGKVVRLAQGKFDFQTEYGSDPVAMAHHWEEQGARWLHIVDLDGAQTGQMKNIEIIKRIAASVKIPIQVGGGIRNEGAAQMLLDAGVNRIILGTRAIEDRNFLMNAIARWNTKIAVSLDCSHGFVTERGWTLTTQIRGVDLAKALAALRVSCLIYTDIAKDGMLQGPNFPALEEMLATVKMPLIASGGVTTLADIQKLKQLAPKGLLGCIVGKAIYAGTLDFKEAVRVCSISG